MNRQVNPDALLTKKELEKLLLTLKANREKVPLHILKSKYKTGYEELCKKISLTATKYTKQMNCLFYVHLFFYFKLYILF